MKGITFVANLEIRQLTWKEEKQDVLAMIRQLGLPTWLMSLSAADSRWNDLLKILAKLNDAVDYSDMDIESLSWQQKTKLVQKDPVTCSDTLIIECNSSFIQYLKVIINL